MHGGLKDGFVSFECSYSEVVTTIIFYRKASIFMDRFDLLYYFTMGLNGYDLNAGSYVSLSLNNTYALNRGRR